MPVPAPTPDTRWRCTLCGNLTRFDVQRSTRSREYVHVSLGGDAVVEEREVLTEVVEHVTCRWCGRVDSVELTGWPGVAADAPPASSEASSGPASPVAAPVPARS